MASYTKITYDEMANFLEEQGFLQIQLPGVKELVYARRQDADSLNLSLRVYTGINPDGQSREVGEDAIRVVLFWRREDGTLAKAATSKRVHRVKGWKKNLQDRIDKTRVEKRCECGAPMVRRKKGGLNGGEFFGCSTFPVCRRTESVSSNEALGNVQALCSKLGIGYIGYPHTDDQIEWLSRRIGQLQEAIEDYEHERMRELWEETL